MNRIIKQISCVMVILTALVFVVNNCHRNLSEISPAKPSLAEGCKRCHPDLSEVLPQGSLKDINKMLLKAIHASKGASEKFEWLVHLSHYGAEEFTGDCWSCHRIDSDKGFQLIEEEKENGVDVSEDMVIRMDAYFHSWAGSEYLDHRHAKQGVSCRHCHGTFFVEKRITMEQCLGCHESYQQLASLTQDVTPNPHDSHSGEIKCTLCHKAHEPSELYCNMCHEFDLSVP